MGARDGKRRRVVPVLVSEGFPFVVWIFVLASLFFIYFFQKIFVENINVNFVMRATCRKIVSMIIVNKSFLFLAIYCRQISSVRYSREHSRKIKIKRILNRLSYLIDCPNGPLIHYENFKQMSTFFTSPRIKIEKNIVQSQLNFRCSLWRHRHY